MLAFGISAVAFILLLLAVPLLDPRFPIAVGVGAAVVGIIALAQAVIAMFSRQPEYFLFIGGLVERKGTRLRTITWPEVQTITVRASRLGSIVTRTGFDVKPGGDGVSRSWSA